MFFDNFKVVFHIFFGIFIPKIGEDEAILTSILFQMGWFNHQPDLNDIEALKHCTF